MRVRIEVRVGIREQKNIKGTTKALMAILDISRFPEPSLLPVFDHLRFTSLALSLAEATPSR